MILKRDSQSGAYADATLLKDNPVNRYTVFVRFLYDPGDPENGPVLYESWEEIDVDAATEGHAREIAAAALKRDYMAGGQISHVQQRFGLYL